ncbi:hypothetical protein HanRHA438_Chr07g0320021 [Helianthus annuus]|nr:hypothetical protein HanRHA438_Chr07g0320021 [Helianthus annuus]
MTENHDFKAPRPMTNKKGQDPNMYCDFHKDIGHLTDDCISLRQKIEKALKSGKQGHLVKNMRKETRQIQRMVPKKPRSPSSKPRAGPYSLVRNVFYPNLARVTSPLWTSREI